MEVFESETLQDEIAIRDILNTAGILQSLKSSLLLNVVIPRNFKRYQNQFPEAGNVFYYTEGAKTICAKPIA